MKHLLKRYNKFTQRISNTFTIIELIVVVAVIGVLATITIVSYSSIQSGSRDTQRSSRLKIISEALEKYYQQYGQYPDCDAMIASPSVVADTLKNLDPDVLTTPSDAKGTNSFICDMEPATDKFAYIGGGAEYTLQYKEEGSGDVISIPSRKQGVNGMFSLTLAVVPLNGGTVSGSGSYAVNTVRTIATTPVQFYQFSSWTGSTGCAGAASHTITMDDDKACTANFVPTTVTAPAAPVVSTNTVGATTTWSWGAATCTGGSTAQYQYYYTNSVGYDSGWVGPQTGLSVPLTTSTEGVTYTVAVQARCHNPVTDSAWSASESANYTRINTVPNPVCSTASSTSIGCTWPAVSGATSYTLQIDDNSGFSSPTPTVPNPLGSATLTYTFTGLPQGVTQYIRAYATGPGGTSQWSTTDTATTWIDATTMTVVTANTVGGTTTWSWPAVATCPAGTTARYQYDYQDSIPTDSGWIGPQAGLSVSRPTATEGLTYTVYVQVQCFTTPAASAWSSPTWASYYRPRTYVLTVNGGTGSGTYTEGSTATITATPPQYYQFSSWSGSTGCAGVSSHSILMDGPKNCTANFTPIPVATPAAPVVTANTVGATTTWSWGAATCTGGNTAGYQYYYSYTPPAWNSGWLPNPSVRPFHVSTSVGFTTSNRSCNLYGSSSGYMFQPSRNKQLEWLGISKLLPTNFTYRGLGILPGTIATGTQPRGIVVSPDGTSVYVVNYGSNTISQYTRNTSTGLLTAKVPATIASSIYPSSIAISADGTSVYITSLQGYAVSQYTRDTSTGLLTAKVPRDLTTGFQTRDVTVAPDDKHVYVDVYGANNIHKFSRNLSTGALTSLGTTAASSSPICVKVSDDGISLYAVNSNGPSVWLYTRNPSTGALTYVGSTATGASSAPYGLLVSPDSKSVYVTKDGLDNVASTVAILATGVLTALSPATMATGGGPRRVEVSSDNISALRGKFHWRYRLSVQSKH